MSYHKIRYRNFELEYKIIGDGPKAMLGFHGFGRSAEDYEMFRDALGSTYRLYSFNLFHHGNTQYPQERIKKNTIQMEEIRELYAAVINQLELDKVAIMGYSMGGKYALIFAQYFPEKMERLILIAPDGIFINKWYYWGSHTWLGRKLYQTTIHRPKWFFRCTKFLVWLRIIPPKASEFVTRNMHSIAQRQQVFDTWMSLRDIHPDNKIVQVNLNRYQIRTDFLYGEFDLVFPPKIGERYLKKVPHGVLHRLPSGHTMITPKTAAYIQKNLLDLTPPQEQNSPST